MTDRLTGKVALVTGAGQGIGRGIALALSKEGADVVLAGRTLAKCTAVAAEIAAIGGSAHAVACDVGSRTQFDAAVAETVERFGGLDALINNASASTQGPLAEVTDEDVELSWRNGALGTLYGMQAAFPHLRNRGGGSIVNFGSSTAIRGDSMFGAYVMAKEAIRAVSRVAAREWGRYNIRVNVVVPNADSPASDVFKDNFPKQYAAAEKSLMLQRRGDAEADIGRAVVALLSDDLNYLTADTLMLTGGL